MSEHAHRPLRDPAVVRSDQGSDLLSLVRECHEALTNTRGDGIVTVFGDSLKVTGSPQDIAQRMLDQHGRITDDALMLGVRYLGVNA